MGLLKKYYAIVIVLLMIFFAILCGGYIYQVYDESFNHVITPSKDSNSTSNTRAEWGQLGDYFGGTLNPVFGFLSFVGLLLTLIIQIKSLEKSSEELELSREELAKSSTALIHQNKAIELQSFEQTFFSWLNTYRSILSSIQDNGGFNEETLNGRPQLFRWWYQNLSWNELYIYIRDINNTENIVYFPESVVKNIQELEPKEEKIKSFLIDTALEFPQDSTKLIMHKWAELYQEEEYQLDSLFRVLYRLLVWVDSQDHNRLTGSQKWLYISIIRSQLSWVEMAYLYMNGLTSVGKKFKTIAEKYALFDNLNFNSDTLLQILKTHTLESEGYLAEAYSSELAREKLGLPKSSEETLALATSSTFSIPSN